MMEYVDKGTGLDTIAAYTEDAMDTGVKRVETLKSKRVIYSANAS